MTFEEETGIKGASVLKVILYVFLGIMLLIGIFSTFYTIDSQESGVLLTFGKTNPVAKTSGLHMKIPYGIQHIVKYDITTQKYETGASAASKDLQIVSTSIAVNFKISPESTPSIYTNVGKDYENRLVQPSVQEVVKSVTAQFTAEELITNREIVKDLIKAKLMERLLPSNIIISEISITNFDFSESFNVAIESKVTAEQLKLKAERDLQRIEVEAQQKVAAAMGDKLAAIAKAEGEAQAVSIINEKLRTSPDYIEFMKLQKWDGKLPTTIAGSAMPFLSLN